MKKLLAILVLGLFLTSCTQQNKLNIYANLLDKKDSKTTLLEILKNQETTIFKWFEVRVFVILEEKSDRIIFELSYKNSLSDIL